MPKIENFEDVEGQFKTQTKQNKTITENIDSNLITMEKLLDEFKVLQRKFTQHLGYALGAGISINPNFPHPQLSTASRGTYTMTNVTTDRTMDADTAVAAEIADVLGTLITDLKAIGILG